MASNSDRKSGSSESSGNRKVVRIDTSPRNRRMYEPAVPESARRTPPARAGSPAAGRQQRNQRDEEHAPPRRPPRSGARAGASAAPSGELGGAAKSKRDERERRRAERVRRARLRAALVALVVVALVAGAVAIYRSQVFDVRTVEVLGATHSTPEDVIARAAVPPDATLLRFSADAIKQRVLADPWVKDATITRRFPHTLRIRLEERAALGVVDTGVGLFVVDRDGFVLAEQSVESTTTLPTFRNTPGLDLKVGRKSTSEVLANALAALSGIGPEIGATVKAVTAPTIDETMLVTADNVEIMIGEAREMPKKALIVKQILREQAGSVVFIDVRSTERPVSRGLPE